MTYGKLRVFYSTLIACLIAIPQHIFIRDVLGLHGPIGDVLFWLLIWAWLFLPPKLAQKWFPHPDRKPIEKSLYGLDIWCFRFQFELNPIEWNLAIWLELKGGLYLALLPLEIQIYWAKGLWTPAGEAKVWNE